MSLAHLQQQKPFPSINLPKTFLIGGRGSYRGTVNHAHLCHKGRGYAKGRSRIIFFSKYSFCCKIKNECSAQNKNEPIKNGLFPAGAEFLVTDFVSGEKRHHVVEQTFLSSSSHPSISADGGAVCPCVCEQGHAGKCSIYIYMNICNKRTVMEDGRKMYLDSCGGRRKQTDVSLSEQKEQKSSFCFIFLFLKKCRRKFMRYELIRGEMKEPVRCLLLLFFSFYVPACTMHSGPCSPVL